VEYEAIATLNSQSDVNSVPDNCRDHFHTFGPYGTATNIEWTLTVSGSATHSTTEQTGHTITAGGDIGKQGTSTATVAIGLLSLAVSSVSHWNLQVEYSINRSRSKTVSDTQSISATYKVETQVAGDGSRLKWYSYTEMEDYSFTVDYYLDENEADGIPDSAQRSTETITVRVVEGSANTTELIPAQQ